MAAGMENRSVKRRILTLISEYGDLYEKAKRETTKEAARSEQQ